MSGESFDRESAIERLKKRVPEIQKQLARKAIESAASAQFWDEQKKEMQIRRKNDIAEFTRRLEDFDGLKEAFLSRMGELNYPYANELIACAPTQMGLQKFMPNLVKAPNLAQRIRAERDDYSKTVRWNVWGYKLWSKPTTRTSYAWDGPPSKVPATANYWLLIGGEVVCTVDDQKSVFWRGEGGVTLNEHILDETSLEESVGAMATYLAKANLSD